MLVYSLVPASCDATMLLLRLKQPWAEFRAGTILQGAYCREHDTYCVTASMKRGRVCWEEVTLDEVEIVGRA